MCKYCAKINYQYWLILNMMCNHNKISHKSLLCDPNTSKNCQVRANVAASFLVLQMTPGVFLGIKNFFTLNDQKYLKNSHFLTILVQVYVASNPMHTPTIHLPQGLRKMVWIHIYGVSPGWGLDGYPPPPPQPLLGEKFLWF